MACTSPDCRYPGVPNEPAKSAPGCECLPAIPGVSYFAMRELEHRIEQTSLSGRLEIQVDLEQIDARFSLPVLTYEGSLVDLRFDSDGGLEIEHGVNRITQEEILYRCDTNKLEQPGCLVVRECATGDIVRTVIIGRNGNIVIVKMFGSQALDFEASKELFEGRQAKIAPLFESQVA